MGTIFFKKEWVYSLSLRNIFHLFQPYLQDFQRGQESTVRQEDLLEGRLSPDSLACLISLIVLEFFSVLLVALSEIMKRGSFYRNTASYAQASLKHLKMMFLVPPGKPGWKQESYAELIWSNNCPRVGTRAGSYSRAVSVGREQITWQLSVPGLKKGLRQVTEFPGRHQATRAQVGLPF